MSVGEGDDGGENVSVVGGGDGGENVSGGGGGGVTGEIM